MMDIIQNLELTKPVKIKFAKKCHKYWDADYSPKFNKWGELVCHHIKIYNNRDRTRSIPTLIAHELIHAWQEEKELADIHGKPFQKMAHKLNKAFPELEPIYNPDMDC